MYESQRPLRIGYHVDNGVYPVSPASKRAVYEAKAILEAAGHTLVEWRPPKGRFMNTVLPACCSADSGQFWGEVM